MIIDAKRQGSTMIFQTKGNVTQEKLWQDIDKSQQEGILTAFVMQHRDFDIKEKIYFRHPKHKRMKKHLSDIQLFYAYDMEHYLKWAVNIPSIHNKDKYMFLEFKEDGSVDISNFPSGEWSGKLEKMITVRDEKELLAFIQLLQSVDAKEQAERIRLAEELKEFEDVRYDSKGFLHTEDGSVFPHRIRIGARENGGIGYYSIFGEITRCCDIFEEATEELKVITFEALRKRKIRTLMQRG